jgi:hypothetical protein
MGAVEHPQKRRGSPQRGSPIPPAGCDHDYPVLLLAADEGRRRGFCLGCRSVGAVRESPRAAQLALIDAVRDHDRARGRRGRLYGA